MIFNTLEIINAAVFIGLYFMVFAVSAVVRHILPEKAEISRKTAHFFGGLGSLFFPFLFHDYRIVAGMCFVFFCFLVYSGISGKLKAVHNIGRQSFGAYLFPVSVFLIYILAKDQIHLYFVSILVLTVSDTAAALIGTRYGSVKIPVEGNLKSLEGSLAFAFVTFLCVQIPLL